MRITYGPWGETLEELLDAAGVPSGPAPRSSGWRSCTAAPRSQAAAVAAATERASVGTAITLAFTRSPMITALEALDVDEISGGRFLLGLGSGVQRLNEDWHNARFGKPVAHLREAVRNIREFWRTAPTGEADRCSRGSGSRCASGVTSARSLPARPAIPSTWPRWGRR